MIRKFLAVLCIELLFFATTPAPAQIAGPVLPQFGVTAPGVTPRQYCAKTTDGRCMPFMAQDPTTGALAFLLSAVTGALGYTPPAHVPNAAALASPFSVYSMSVIRDDVNALYLDTGASCTHPDGGWQIQPAPGHCWQTDISKPVSAAIWNVKADGNPLTDDQPAWQAAIAALGLNGGGTLIVPTRYDVSHLISGSSTCSVLGRTLTIGVSSIHILGSSPWGSCFAVNFATGNGIEIGGNPTAPTAISPANVSIEHVGFFNTVPRTSGANVSVFQSSYTRLEHIQCKGPNYWSCIDLDGNNAKTGDGVTRASNNLDTTVRDLWAAYGGQSGIRIGCNPLMTNGVATTSSPVNVVLDHIELDNHAADAEEVCGVGGILQTNINTDFNGHGFHAHPVGGQHISGIFSTQTTFDASAREGFLVDTTAGGYFHENKFYSLWVGGSGTGISQNLPGWAPSRGLAMVGGARLNTIIGNTMDVLVLATGQECFVIDGGVTDLEASGELTGCSQSAAGGYQGFLAVGATHWSWRGRIGAYNGAIDGNGNNVLPENQAYGVYVTDAVINGTKVQNGDYFTISGDLSRNQTGPLFINASGTNYSLDGVLPALPWIAFTPTLSCGSNSLPATYSATMRYQVVGKTVRYNSNFSLGTQAAPNCAYVIYTAPFPAASKAICAGNDATTHIDVIHSASSQNVTTQYYNGNPTVTNSSTPLNFTTTCEYERQ